MDKTIDWQHNKTTTSDQQQASFIYEDKPVKKTTNTDYSSVNAKPYETSK
jgi:hypothetical protein